MKMHSQNPPPSKSLRHHDHVHVLLPEEIIEEIMSRLPVESLLKFRCVSKAWLSLIDSDRFIKIHFQNSTKNRSFAHHRVVYDVKQGVMHGCSLPLLLNSNSSEEVTSSTIIIDPTNNLPKADRLVGCCNGVLCLSNCPEEDGSFVLWNPATRVFIELPKLDRLYRKCGFGWDETSGAFKVFASTNSPDSKEISGQVYSSKTNSWKPIPMSSTLLFSSIGAFVAGKIHWVVGLFDRHEECVIESFNLESDEFGRIELPPFNAIADGEEGCLTLPLLGEMGRRLCTVGYKENNIDIWVMKEYGVKGSWFKMFTFPLVSNPPPLFGEGLNEEVFIMNDGCIFMALSTVTNMKPTFGEGSIYVESLVSPYVK